MKKKFFLDKQIVGMSPYEEILEFDDDTTDEEIKECFTEWVFDCLDSAIIDVED